MMLLSESTGLENVGLLLGQAGVVGVLLVWLTRVLVPRLQDDLAKARAEFQADLAVARREFMEASKSERAEFVAALRETRAEFIDAIKESRAAEAASIAVLKALVTSVERTVRQQE